MKSICFLILIALSFCCIAQSSHPDSLLKKGKELLYENPKRAIALVKPILLSGDEEQVFEACYLIGDCQYLLGEFNESLKSYESCLKLGEAQEDEDKISKGYLGIGSIYSENGNPDLAFEFYFKALEIRERLGDQLATANVLNNIAVLFHNQGKLEKAISYMHQVSRIDCSLQDSMSMGFSFSNLGAFHYYNDNTDSALYYHNKALSIRTALKDKFQMSRSMNNIANVFVEIGQLDKAIDLYQKAISIRRDLNNRHELALSLNNVGESLVANEKYKEAFPYLTEANGILDSLDDVQMLLDNSLNLARTYYELGRFKEGYEMLRKTYDLNRKVFNEAKSLQSQEMMAKFETERTEKENEGLRAEKAEQDLTIVQAENRVYLLIGGLSIFALLALLILGKLRANKKNTNTLKGLYDQLEEKNSNIVDSINYAKRIQKAILPPLEKFREMLPNSFIFYRPKDVVAGDFYWMKEVGDKKLFAVADCTGHGVPGAMVSVVCNNALNRAVHEDGLNSPEEILNRTREIVQDEFGKSNEEVKDGMDIALCLLEKNVLTFSGAHNPVWIIREGEFETNSSHKVIQKGKYSLLEIKGDKQPVGKFDFGKAFQAHQFELKKEDSLYIFSDGYADQFGGKDNKKYKSVNFKNLLLDIQTKNQEEQLNYITEMFDSWKGDVEQLDDVCVLGIKI